MFKCFNDDFCAVPIDQQARKFGHKLTSHQAVSLENFSRLILAYPKNKIVYSKGLSKNCDDFENAQHEHGIGMSIEEAKPAPGRRSPC